ncbi:MULTISPECIES: ComEC/Rec2 family competence protein [Gracilibacillus]|uniref:hydrolase n=1 Tax=Gracilibacillus TaxID=74385 RepID=UPI00082693B7|nr:MULTISPECIES: hydrolase [Gracilibacillus]
MKYQIYGLFILVFLLMGANAVSIPSIPKLDEGEMDMLFMNLPDGEASLLTNAKGENVLINTASERSQKQLYQMLSRLNIDTLDWVIITNPDEAYTGNLDYLIDHYQVKKIVVPISFETARIDSQKVEKWNLSQNYAIWDNLNMEAFDQSEEGNISFLLHYEKETILFLNHHGEMMEKRLLQLVQDVDMIKIADFGSVNSPSEQLLARLDPYLCVIFPSQTEEISDALVERLSATWIDVYFLQQTGSVYVRLTGRDYEILTGNSAVNA